MRRSRGNQTPCALLHTLPPHTSAGGPPLFVFVTAKKLGDILRQISAPDAAVPNKFSVLDNLAVPLLWVSYWGLGSFELVVSVPETVEVPIRNQTVWP